ncbi:MAG: hypothetical protein JSR46_03465 [Verrucomicrobia bacterium]|nr:hypothetical protein [Verrucomicrobiota bacterium]
MDPELFAPVGQKLLDGTEEEQQLFDQIIKLQTWNDDAGCHPKPPPGVQYVHDPRWWWPCGKCWGEKKLTIITKKQQREYIQYAMAQEYGYLSEKGERNSYYCEKHRPHKL